MQLLTLSIYYTMPYNFSSLYLLLFFLLSFHKMCIFSYIYENYIICEIRYRIKNKKIENFLQEMFDLMVRPSSL